MVKPYYNNIIQILYEHFKIYMNSKPKPLMKYGQWEVKIYILFI